VGGTFVAGSGNKRIDSLKSFQKRHGTFSVWGKKGGGSGELVKNTGIEGGINLHAANSSGVRVIM